MKQLSRKIKEKYMITKIYKLKISNTDNELNYKEFKKNNKNIL